MCRLYSQTLRVWHSVGGCIDEACPRCMATFTTMTERQAHDVKCRILFDYDDVSTTAPPMCSTTVWRRYQRRGRVSCPQCNLVCEDAIELRRHRRIDHVNDDMSSVQEQETPATSSVACTQCSGKFASQTALDVHTSAVHAAVQTRDTRIVCILPVRPSPPSGQRVQGLHRVVRLRREPQRSSQEAPHGTHFTFEWFMNVTVGYRTVRCSVCAKSFTNRATLDIHERKVHHAAVSHPMAVCSTRATSARRCTRSRSHWRSTNYRLMRRVLKINDTRLSSAVQRSPTSRSPPLSASCVQGSSQTYRTVTHTFALFMPGSSTTCIVYIFHKINWPGTIPENGKERAAQLEAVTMFDS